MQDDAEIGLAVHTTWDFFSIELATESDVTIIFYRGLRPFQDAYGTKLATARRTQRPASSVEFFFFVLRGMADAYEIIIMP